MFLIVLILCLLGESVVWNIIFFLYLKFIKCLKYDYSIFCMEGIIIIRLDMFCDFIVCLLLMIVEVVYKINICFVIIFV